MTLILLRIDNQLQCIVGLTFVTGTKDFMVTTQSTNNNQKTTFICSPESTYYFLLKLYSRTLPRIIIKVRTENFKRLLATDIIFIPGDLDCGSAELTI